MSTETERKAQSRYSLVPGLHLPMSHVVVAAAVECLIPHIPRIWYPLIFTYFQILPHLCIVDSFILTLLTSPFPVKGCIVSFYYYHV